MSILKVSEQLLKLSEEKIRIPADVDTTQDDAPCPQCGMPYDGEICEYCGFIAPKAEQALQIYQQQEANKKQAKSELATCPSCGSDFDGLSCSCGHIEPPMEFKHPRDQRPKGKENTIGRDPGMKFKAWEDPNKPKKKKKKKAAVAKDNVTEVQTALPTRIHDAEQSVLQMDDELQQDQPKQGARMSRFDNELTPREAAVPNVTYDQTSNMYLDGPFGLSSQAPTPEVDAWKDIYPDRFIDVRDLDASGADVMGGPGSNAVRARMPFDQDIQPTPELLGKPAQFGQPGGIHQYNQPNDLTKAATIQYPGIEETLYKAYEASRDLRTALKETGDGDFSILKDRLAQVVRELQSNKKIASRKDIGAAKFVLKLAEDTENAKDDDEMDEKEARKNLKEIEKTLDSLSKIGTNGRQETDMMTDVRDLDDQAGIFDRQKYMTPDFQTNVLVPNQQPNQLALADVPDDYNDGGETGFGLAYNYHREPWPNDATNPALAPFQPTANVVQAAVQAGKEKILEAIEVVDRLERLGMVQHDDRANHIAKFEQMSDSKLAGFKASIDMLEESGAHQPRSQKVASGNTNRLPEMGRLTTASTVSQMDVKSDDFLMTL